MTKILLLIRVIVLCMCMMLSAESFAQTEASIKVQLEENLSVDAVVNIPDLPSLSASVVTVRRVIPDIQLLKDVLIPNAKIVNEYTYEDYEGYAEISCDGDEGISVSKEAIFFWTPFGNIISQLNGLEDAINDETLGLPDLNFSSREAAVERVSSALGAMGISNAHCSAAYALPADRLQTYSDLIRNNKDFQEDIKAGRISLKQDWGIEDECYVLKFEFLVSSIPVFRQDSNGGGAVSFGMNENHFLSSDIEVIFSADGIVHLIANNVVEEVSRDDPQALLPAEQVPELIRDRYKNLIVAGPTVVREITLKYILQPVAGKETLELIPAWCCMVTTQYADGESVEWIAFDARDGSIRY